MKPSYPLFNDEPGAAGGGAAPPAAAPAPPPAPAAAPAAPAATVLQAAAPASGEPAAAPAAPPDPNAWIPEKFRVMGADGKTLDMEASAKKVEEHRSNLEKRLGTGDIPPKTVDEYKANVPERYADTLKAEDLAKDPMYKDFLAKAHAKGMTQGQVDLCVDEMLARYDFKEERTAEECTATLKEVWKSDAEFKEGQKAAYRAAKTYGGDEFDGILKDYGNDPRIIKMLASVGKELGEDTSASVNARGNTDMDNVKNEHAQLAGWHNDSKNQKSAEFSAKNERYKQLGEKMWGTGARKTGSITVTPLK